MATEKSMEQRRAQMFISLNGIKWANEYNTKRIAIVKKHRLHAEQCALNVNDATPNNQKSRKKEQKRKKKHNFSKSI